VFISEKQRKCYSSCAKSDFYEPAMISSAYDILILAAEDRKFSANTYMWL
jgi:hypothetical protein